MEKHPWRQFSSKACVELRHRHQQSTGSTTLGNRYDINNELSDITSELDCQSVEEIPAVAQPYNYRTSGSSYAYFATCCLSMMPVFIFYLIGSACYEQWIKKL